MISQVNFANPQKAEKPRRTVSKDTFHQRALTYLAKSLGGQTNQLPPSQAYRVGLHSYPDVIVGKDRPIEIHEVDEVLFKSVKLREYEGSSIPTILWLLSPSNLIDAFDEIRTLFLDDDRYWKSESIWKNQQRPILRRLDELLIQTEVKERTKSGF